MSSGGHFPAGCDARLPKHCVYPGAVAFLNELDTGHVLRIQASSLRVLRPASCCEMGMTVVFNFAQVPIGHLPWALALAVVPTGGRARTLRAALTGWAGLGCGAHGPAARDSAHTARQRSL